MPDTDRGGVTLYWETRGDGEPLLLIMGLGVTLEGWSRIGPELAKRYRTILFDNRGTGRSGTPPGPYSIVEMAADAAAVLDAARVERAHVFGISMGGMIAQEFALQYPSRVRSLILGCTAPGGRDAVPAKKDVIAALGARTTMTREQAMWAMARYIYDASTPRERIAEDFARRLSQPVTADGYFAQLAGIRAWGGALSRLPSIVAPTLVIHGETDELVPPENGRTIARAIPNARLVMLPRASHIFTTDAFDASLDAVLSFLKEHADVTEHAVS
ncbi:MAG TPA: alpha/beta fold hydrolase [Vicinamibacterales bacterium]|nr:alpha/beta fold hydrolase [Vicinamibacterales bacterium]